MADSRGPERPGLHGFQRTAHGTAADDVDDGVVDLAVASEVLLLIVDDLVGPDLEQLVELAGAVHGRHLCAGDFGELSGKRTDAAACAAQENPSPDLPSPTPATRKECSALKPPVGTEVRLVSFRAMKEPAHLALHPFGQIPTYEEGDLALFETGAIVFHIAERHAGLLPEDANARARAITWMFAAVNTVEPPILELGTARLLEGDKPWNKERLPLVEERVRDRLKQLSARLGNAGWLDGAFSAGDLMIVSVLLRLKSSGILDEYPNVSAHVARGEARPAYKRAFDAQYAVFTSSRNRSQVSSCSLISLSSSAPARISRSNQSTMRPSRRSMARCVCRRSRADSSWCEYEMNAFISVS